MASRRGRGRATPTRSRDPRDQYYAVSSSDHGYVEESRHRMHVEARRRWIIRLGVLAAIMLALWLWGRPAIDRALFQSNTTSYEFQKAGEGVKAANDRRTGANFNENP